MNGLPTSAPRDGASSPALYDITPNMVALVSSVRDKFGARYAREDLEAVYAEMMRQKKQKTTGYAFRKKELVWMLNCCGLDCTLQTPDRDLRAQIAQLPSRETLEAGLFAELYRIYTSFPSSGLYMERLVRRLGDPDLGGGSVRMAILKQFIRHTDYHTAAILRQVAGQDPAAYAAACAAVPQKARRQASAEYVLAHITEDIFSLLHQQDVQLSETDLARISLPKLKSHRLIDLVKTFGAPVSTHRADDDVVATCAVFRILLAAVAAMPAELVSYIAHCATREE